MTKRHPDSTSVLCWINAERKKVFPRSHGFKSTDGTLKLISARLNEGYAVDELQRAFRYVLYDDKLREWADYTTPFRPSNFPRYLERGTLKYGDGKTEVNDSGFDILTDEAVDERVRNIFKVMFGRGDECTYGENRET